MTFLFKTGEVLLSRAEVICLLTYMRAIDPDWRTMKGSERQVKFGVTEVISVLYDSEATG